MAAEIEFENEEIKDFLKNLNTRLKDIKGGQKKYVGLISSIVYRDVDKHFQDEEGSEGKWPIWSLSYAMTVNGRGAFRKFRGRTVFLDPYDMEELNIKPPRKPGGILKDSGRLRNSFKPQNYRSTSEGILWFNNAKTKSGFPYAFAHNEGGEQLPKRDFMWLTDKAQEEVAVETLQFMIDEGV